MKQTMLALMFGLAALTGTAALAQDAPRMGTSHFSIEMDYMFLQHRTFATDDFGIYMGLAGYGHLKNNWYLGGEIGVGGSVGLFGYQSSSYTPLELNVKRAFGLSRRLAVDLGAGLSYSRVKYSHNIWLSPEDNTYINEWVSGGQVFADIVFQAGWVQVGAKFKYQLTADAQEVAALISPAEGWDYSNLKIGFQIGFLIPD